MSFMSVEHLVVFLQTGFFGTLRRRVLPLFASCVFIPPNDHLVVHRDPKFNSLEIMVKKRLTEVQKAVALTLLSEGWKQQDVADKLWQERTPTSYLRKLSDSMPRRLQQVIDANANMTKY